MNKAVFKCFLLFLMSALAKASVSGLPKSARPLDGEREFSLPALLALLLTAQRIASFFSSVGIRISSPQHLLCPRGGHQIQTGFWILLLFWLALTLGFGHARV